MLKVEHHELIIWWMSYCLWRLLHTLLHTVDCAILPWYRVH